MSAPLWLFIWVMFLAFAWYRLRLYLHYFQQEEYDAPRFLKWIVTSGSYDRRVSIFIALLAVLAEFLPRLQVGWVASAVVAGLLLSTAWRERKPCAKREETVGDDGAGKTHLCHCIRLCRRHGARVFVFLSQSVWWIIPIQLMPLMLAFAVWTLAPSGAVCSKEILAGGARETRPVGAQGHRYNRLVR